MPPNVILKEFTDTRTEKDEAAIQRIVNIVSDRMTNPFIIEDEASPQNKQPLINIATSVVADPDITNYLCNIR